MVAHQDCMPMVFPAEKIGPLSIEWHWRRLRISMGGRREPIRFLLAGAVVNATDYGVYLLLIHFLSFSASKAISFTCAGIAGYGINKYWTFKHGPASYAEVGRYVVINFLALGVNVLTNQIILAVRPGSVLFALIAASAAAGVLTFIGFKWWVFRVQAI
jgi:putative flippase GtrA